MSQWLSTEKPKAVMIATLKLILFWLSQMIYLMGTQSAGVAYRITVKSQQVKVRLPLNLKNMREVHGVSTCVVPVYAACQVCMCVCGASVHVCQCIMCRQTAEVKNNYDLVYWLVWVRQNVSRRSCMCTSIIKYASQRKVCILVWTRFSINEYIRQIPRIMANPEHWLIPQCNASWLNVKKKKII